MADNADGRANQFMCRTHTFLTLLVTTKNLRLQYNFNFSNNHVPGLNWTSAFVYGWDIKC